MARRNPSEPQPPHWYRSRLFVELFFELAVIFSLLVIVYFGILFVGLAISDRLYPYLWENYRSFALSYYGTYEYTFFGIFSLAFLLTAIAILMWRVRHRYRAVQLAFILQSLHYIAEGHYDYKIPTKHMSSMRPIIDSINRLVDSTVRAMEEERQSEQSKDELIGNMSHDIRTPLTSIIGYLGLLNTKKFQNEEEAAHYVQIAYNKSLQMKGMVEDLFEYTKVSQINSKLDIQRIDVVQLLEQLTAEFEMEAEEVHRKFELQTHPDKIFIDLDAEKISRVFSNLITNAFKYGGDGSYIRIEVDQQEDQTHFMVANDGVKIAQDQLKNLFQRFYRGDTSRSTKGSGLGLAIAQSIVQSHQGEIWVESDENSTRFYFTIPNEQPKEEKGSEN